jgi:hypothetical protein
MHNRFRVRSHLCLNCSRLHEQVARLAEDALLRRAPELAGFSLREIQREEFRFPLSEASSRQPDRIVTPSLSLSEAKWQLDGRSAAGVTACVAPAAGWHDRCLPASERSGQGGLIYFRHNLLRMADKICELF